MLVTGYDGSLVLLSFLVATLSFYTGLQMTARLSQATACSSRWWMIGGAFALGIGIWSRHFIGLLSLRLPIPLGFDPAITALSLLVAILFSGLALTLVAKRELTWSKLFGGAVLMGGGLAAMHFVGMAALRMHPAIKYDPSSLALVVALSILASGLMLWVAFRLRGFSPRMHLLRAGAAILMSLAVVWMHNFSMATARFPAGSVCGAAATAVDLNWVALVIVITTCATLAIALIISELDLRLQTRTETLTGSLAQANQQLTHLSLHDRLTRLPNRLLLEDRLHQEILGEPGSSPSFVVMYLDLDDFKTVNDAFGHQAGDELLAEVAARIKDNVRSQDTLARVGGDEFVLLTKTRDPAEAATLAHDLLEAVQQPFTLKGRLLHISTSIGIAVYPNDAGNDGDILANAEAAMRHAKAGAHNSFSFFEGAMNANVREQLQLAQDLRLAIGRNELLLQYQPKFKAPIGPMTGVEALVRWNHPGMGLLGPDRFIPLAEKSGLIVPIGEWVLNEACRQMNAWHGAGWRDLTMSVNLSAAQFAHSDLLQTVSNALTRNAVEARWLTLEVTESTAMRDADKGLRMLQQLRELGVQISIDDFGTGYSSLLYLKRLPANELKIDRGFVCDLEKGCEDAAIISTIVALGRALRLDIVAEGVETPAQQELLTDLGCNALQGFLLGRPMHPDQLISLFGHPQHCSG